MKYILTKKLGMTTLYNDGIARPVTLLEVGKNIITQIRNIEKDGYLALQVGLVNEKKEGTYLQKSEVRLDKAEEHKLGDELLIDQFEIDEKVSVRGISKGKGFQGVVKRHGFRGAPASHGHKHDLRAPGSIGSGWPQHVMKGKKMAGRMGADQVTTRNVKIALVDKEKNLLGIEGATPGNRGIVIEVISKA